MGASRDSGRQRWRAGWSAPDDGGLAGRLNWGLRATTLAALVAAGMLDLVDTGAGCVGGFDLVEQSVGSGDLLGRLRLALRRELGGGGLEEIVARFG